MECFVKQGKKEWVPTEEIEKRMGKYQLFASPFLKYEGRQRLHKRVAARKGRVERLVGIFRLSDLI